MKIKPFIVLFCSVALTACRPVPEEPVTVHACASPTQGRAAAMCYAQGEWIYILGGRTQDGHYPTTGLRYHTQTDEWTETGELPMPPRVNGTVCATAQGVFAGLGYAGGNVHYEEHYLHDWWCIDHAANQFRRLADFPAPQTVAPVSWYSDGHIYIACGFHPYTNDVWCYDIATDTWHQAERPSPMRVQSAVAAQCQGRTFAGTGYHNESQSGWWEWFSDGHWESRVSVPGPGRLNAACAATNKAVWVIGGWHYGDSLTTGFHYDDILRYTPTTDRWTLCGTLPCGSTENGVACSDGNRLYIGLGEDKNQQIHTDWYYIEE